MVGLIIWLIVVIIVGVLILAVAKSILAWPVFQPYQPYANTIYALIVLLIFLVCLSLFYNGYPASFNLSGPHRIG
jgi:hypothetical protein